MAALLEVQDLRAQFHTREGLVYAVNGISYKMDEGETLGIVGESGCGKSVGVLSLLCHWALEPAVVPAAARAD